MSYAIEIKKQATKFINKLSRTEALRIRNAIDAIALNPLIGEQLTNHNCAYKYRVGTYRILYDVYEKELQILIIKVGPRGDVYN